MIMATTTKRAQEQLGNTKCDICDTYKDVIWRCLNCQETLCNQCKTYHLRSKATRNHTITGLANTTEENPGTSIFCHEHENEAFQKYCETCNTLVCLECIIGTHKNHEYKQIGDIIKQNRTQLEETFNQINTRKIPELEQSILSITQTKKTYRQEIHKLTKAITTKGRELKEIINSLINILKQEVIQQATKDEKCLKETKEQIDQKLTTLKTQLSKQEERVKRFGDFDIIVKTDGIKNSLSKITENSPDIPPVQPPIFQTGQNNEEELKKMIGGLVLDMKQCLQDHTRKEYTVKQAEEREYASEEELESDTKEEYEYAKMNSKMKQKKRWKSQKKGWKLRI